MATEQYQPDAAALRGMLRAARERTLAYAGALQTDQWLGPYLKIVNPPLWEIGHLAWFQEYWCLRYRPDAAQGTLPPPLLADADARYNSAIVPHVERWRLALPTIDQTLDYLCKVTDAVLARLACEGATEHVRYFVQLAVFHEEMHNEAFDYTRQTLAYASKKPVQKQVLEVTPCMGDAAIAGGRFMLGATPEDGFVFDNEKWAHEVQVQPFHMARTAVSNAQFAAFVEEGAYARSELWSDAGWDWRLHANATAPLYWSRQGADWHVRRFDDTLPLEPNAAVIHVNWYEAQAYCAWAQRRLPAEAEWEFAAATAPGDVTRKRRYPWGDTAATASRARLFGGASATVDVAALPGGDSAWGVRQMFGNVWEWTADWFAPYPGFVRDPYKEYSEPWFGNHKVLRGGCYATRANLLRNTWRNFYTPDRRDVLAGFRTCALD
jgi:iron(II)-dependent oxidoreductase